MSWVLCLFSPCKWLHHFNVESSNSVGRAGVYQCVRCRTISIGAPR